MSLAIQSKNQDVFTHHVPFSDKVDNCLSVSEVGLKSSLYDLLVTCNDYQEHRIDEIVMWVFGAVTKQARRLINQVLGDDELAYLGLLPLTHALIKMGVNRDLLFSAWQLVFTEGVFPLLDQGLYTQVSFKRLLSCYNERRLVELLFSQHIVFLEDTDCMLRGLLEKGATFEFMPKKPKKLQQVHDALSRQAKKYSGGNYDLDQREDVIKLDKADLLDDMTIRVPRTHYDLVDLGDALNFCIGNGYYSRQVRDRKNSIVAVYDAKGAKYGVQFTRYTIKSAYGFGNEDLPKTVLAALHNLLTCAPEVPDDFLPIERSFIVGYKYDNKDLYLMIGREEPKIYRYYDVSQDVYEELLSSKSKGGFLNNVLKKEKYAFDRIA
jgi:hypothetical protein